MIYTDVFTFTDMLLHLVETQYDDIRIAFPLYLRSMALFWYWTELIALERHLLLSALVSKLCTALISRFKERPGTALRALISSRFTFHDIRSGKTTPTPALTKIPSTPALIKSSLPLTPALITSSLLPISSLLTTSSIRSSFAVYIKGQIAHLNSIS